MYEQIASNKRRTVAIIVLFVALVALMGWIFGAVTRFGYAGVVAALAVALFMSWSSYYYSDRIVLAMSRARLVSVDEAPHLHNVVEGLAIAAGVPKPRVYVIDDPAPNAFATGRDPEHAAVAVTTGLLQRLDRLELEGVVAHELSHVKNYDIRLMTITAVMVGVVALLADWLRWSFWFGGDREDNRDMGALGAVLMVVGLVMMILAPVVAQLIRLAVSRQREYLADASGAMLTRYPAGLADALEKIAMDPSPLRVANKATAHLFIANPLKEHGGKMNAMFDTHPPAEERVRRLREMSFEEPAQDMQGAPEAPAPAPAG